MTQELWKLVEDWWNYIIAAERDEELCIKYGFYRHDEEIDIDDIMFMWDNEHNS